MRCYLALGWPLLKPLLHTHLKEATNTCQTSLLVTRCICMIYHYIFESSVIQLDNRIKLLPENFMDLHPHSHAVHEPTLCTVYTAISSCHKSNPISTWSFKQKVRRFPANDLDTILERLFFVRITTLWHQRQKLHLSWGRIRSVSCQRHRQKQGLRHR